MSEPAAAAQGRKLRGGLQWIRPDSVRGWAFNPGAPDEHVRVDVYVGGALVGSAVADELRNGLVGRGIGKGDHAFNVTPSVPLPVSAPETIEVIATAGAGQTLTLQVSSAFGRPIKAEKPGAPPTTDEGAPAPPAVAGSIRNLRFAASDSSQHPVFVLGAARSGTSALGRAIRLNTRYMGPGEGHLLHLIPTLIRFIDRHYRNHMAEAMSGGTLIGQVPQRVLHQGLQSMTAEIIRSLFPDGYWMDKTPGAGMIECIPALRRIWPETRCIFTKRRPLENIESRRRKFPQVSFEDHCKLWADSMTAWEDIRAELQGASIEVEQLDMARRPEFVADQVAGLLDLTEVERSGVLESLMHDQPERTTAEFAPLYTLETVGWTDKQREAFLRVCGGPMQRFGYGTDAAYMVGG